MPPRRHLEATAELAARDAVFAALVDRHGPIVLGRKVPVAGRFEALAQSIAYQQLAGKAAAAIWSRVRALTGATFTPVEVLGLPGTSLRGAGLSQAKTDAIRDVARLTDDGTIRLDTVGRLADDDVVAMLTQARGIGPWTAHMFLLFDLQRLDVWPTGDYGVRVGFGRAFGMAEPPTARELDALGERFRPYRSVAAWYCWRVVDSPSPDQS
jgi:3-methyladenine DNA glycosylase/8-oxoguanine DNA glycosylase